MDVKIDKITGTVEAVNPLTGRIEKCSIVKNLKEQAPEVEDQTATVNSLIEKNEKLMARVEFLESNITTMSISDWEQYTAIKEV